MAIGEEELICDFAETYRVLDFKSLPARLAAILAVGMRDDSRIKMKLRGDRLSRRDGLLAMIYDIFAEYIWAIGGAKGDRPASAYRMMSGIEEKNSKPSVRGFDSPEEYEEERRRLLGG